MPKDLQKILRYPVRNNDPLQGWDSADELLLQYMQSQDLVGQEILICCDQFGALSYGLEELQPTTYTDSYVSSMAIRLNTNQHIIPVNNLSDLSGVYDYVLIKIPKSLSYFEDILCHLTKHVKSDSKIICGSMVKHLSKGSFNLLNTIIGATTTSLAQKKARLIFVNFEKEQVESPYPLEVALDGFEEKFTHHSNLFSRERLDIGTRFFLNHIPQGSFQRILDLGCANGIIGFRAKELNPAAQLVFSDDSAMAIQSARRNYKKMFSDEARFEWTNCFENGEAQSMDLVLCNPPFHQENTVGDFIARAMFKDAYKVLKKGGLIRVIGNCHLGYKMRLKALFGNAKVIANNKKFMIIEAVKV
ncbi:methyltransferase [Hymenobacter sp. BT664]|uniref:Methyltransferase n=1 Tax=Hymenobacter montanus TaxID=2771359 RepID=A0A927BBJ6_9BACT|nr:methyltransferase [Hymenobacter montanus]MBD2767129.1 methyltransferase [Hymenobacter montanus]